MEHGRERGRHENNKYKEIGGILRFLGMILKITLEI